MRGLPRPTDFTSTYRDVPDGFTKDEVEFAELQAAGFHKGVSPPRRASGSPPASELVVPGETVLIDVATADTIMADALFVVLRDPSGKIVATWDEGRWWTPEESARFTAALVAALRRLE
jgi:hypothetical protein